MNAIIDKGMFDIPARVSSKTQDERLQEEECVKFGLSKGYTLGKIFRDHGKSAFKNKGNLENRKGMKESNERARSGIIQAQVYYNYNRAFRNKEEFYKYMKEMFEIYNVKVYSVTQPSILSLWEMIEQFDNIQDETTRSLLKGFVKLLWEFLIRQAGEEAEEDSKNKGKFVRLAVRKKEGQVTKSYKGNVWGRSALPTKTINEIVQLKKDNPIMSLQEIADSVWYWDKNKNKKFVSKTAVHKFLSQQNLSNKEVYRR